MQPATIIILAVILIFNICAFAAMGIDKKRARKNEWRIRERTLWLLAVPFSAVGAYAGMRKFHHKTRHNSFAYGMPALAVAQIALAVFLLIKFSARL